MNKLKALVLGLFFVIGVLGTGLHAQTAEEASAYIQNNVQSVVDVLQDANVSPNLKRAQIEAIVAPLFDFNLITKLTTGKASWTGLTPAQRQELLATYRTYLLNFYLSRLNLYTNQEVKYETPKLAGKNKAVVPSKIQSGTQVYTLNYLMYYNKGAWKLYDLEIQGVSVIKTYRAQFNVYLKSGKFDELIKMLK